MKVFDLIDENSVTVDGEPGKDKISANVPAGSFVVPVKVTKGEKIIPPENVPKVDAAIKKAGGTGINDLAPNANPVPNAYIVNKSKVLAKDAAGNLVNRYETKSDTLYTQDYGEWGENLEGKNVPPPLPTDANGKVYVPKGRKPQKLANGGFVDANEDYINPERQDITLLENQPIQPVVPQKKAEQIVRDNEVKAIEGNIINNAYQNIVPVTSGNEEIRSSLSKVQDIIGKTVPVFDEKKAERLKRVAGINSLGQAFSTAFGGYIGSKGGPILDTRSNITPVALAEYNKMIQDDKQYKYRSGLMQAQEAIKGMQDIAANEAANKRYNQMQLAKAQQMVDKFRLDRYADDDKYRRDVDLALLNYGIDAKLLAEKNDYDAKKTATEIKERWRLARYNQSQANARAKLSAGAPDGMIAYWNPYTGKTEFIERSKAMHVIGKAVQERDIDNNPVYKMDELITRPDKFNPEQLGMNFFDLMQKYAPEFIKNNTNQYLTPQGKVVTVTPPTLNPVADQDPDADLLVK